MRKNYLALVLVLFLAFGLKSAAAACFITPPSQPVTENQNVQFNIDVSALTYSNPDLADSYTCTCGISTQQCVGNFAKPSFSVSCNYQTQGSYTVNATIRCSTSPASCLPLEKCSTIVFVNPQSATDAGPSVAIVAPPTGTFLPNGQAVTFSGTASDDYKVSAVDVRICCPQWSCGNRASASLSQTASASTGWSYSWTPNYDLQYRDCKFSAIARDNNSVETTATNLFSIASAGTPAAVATTTSYCMLTTSRPTLASVGSVSATIIYQSLSNATLASTWTAVFDCGNGKTATASCSGTTGSCAATCNYDKSGNFIVSVKQPAGITGLCGTRLVSAQFIAAPNATNATIPIITPPAPPSECEHNECEWQQQCYPEGTQNPSYNDSGNCAYGVCSGGKWLPKPEGVSCGQGSLCCAGQCRPSECVNNAECASRVYEGKACYKFNCQQPGTCTASCEPEISPSNCGGAGCAVGAPEYCANLACGPHSDKKCNCGETTDEYPDECTQETAQLIFLLNRTTSLPSKIVFGQPLNITVPYQSPETLASVKCEQEGCKCADVPDEQSILCQIYSAKEMDYTLAATDAKNRTYKTALKVTAAGVAAVIMDATPEWQRWLYIVGSLAAVGILVGGAYAARAKMVYDSPPEEYKRVIRGIESFGGREKTLMGMYMQGKLSERAIAEQRKLLEKEERDLAARKKELEQIIGPAKAEELAKATKEEMLEKKAKAAIQKSMKEAEKKPPEEGDLGKAAPYTGKF